MAEQLPERFLSAQAEAVLAAASSDPVQVLEDAIQGGDWGAILAWGADRAEADARAGRLLTLSPAVASEFGRPAILAAYLHNMARCQVADARGAIQCPDEPPKRAMTAAAREWQAHAERRARMRRKPLGLDAMHLMLTSTAPQMASTREDLQRMLRTRPLANVARELLEFAPETVGAYDTQATLEAHLQDLRDRGESISHRR